MTRQINNKPRLKNYLTLICLVIPLIVVSQKQGNIWYFGDHAGLDFNSGTPSPLLDGQTYIMSPYGWNEGCSVISDSSGSLLFYTNGEKIWDKNHQIMTNGNGLLGHRSSSQSSIIVPQPGSSRYFYVFTTDASENDFQNGLRYSIVDMCLDNGYGDIIADKKNIKLLDTTNEKLICIPHSNGIDYWIITHQNNSDAFYSFKLTSSGIIDTLVYHGGNYEYNSTGALGGQMAASPNGLHIAYAKPSAVSGFTLLLDFDPSTGIISNAQTLSTLNTEYAVAFSPNSSKLFFSTAGHGEIFQYDLNAGNLAAIIASKTYIIQSGPEVHREMQLGPNGIIYIARAAPPKEYLSAIVNPDSVFQTGNFLDTAIYLGGKLSSWGLPNLIAGYNYSNTTFNCTLEGIGENAKDEILLYPNPVSDYISIDLKGKMTFEILNLNGQILKSVKGNNTSLTLDLTDLSSGVYIVRVMTDKEIITKKIIKE